MPGPQISPATPQTPSQKAGPIASAATNPYLHAIAELEQAAHALTAAAHHLADSAVQAHAGYEAAQGAIKPAAAAWHAVGKASDELAGLASPADPQLAAALASAKMAVPGVRASVLAALHDLGALHRMLLEDQAQKRPDLPPAVAIDPYEPPSSPWLPLAIAAGIGYLLWKAVF